MLPCFQSELQDCRSRLGHLEAELQKANNEAYNAEHRLTQLSVKVGRTSSFIAQPSPEVHKCSAVVRLAVVVVVVSPAEQQRGAAGAHLPVEPAARPAEGGKPRSERAAGRRGATLLHCESARTHTNTPVQVRQAPPPPFFPSLLAVFSFHHVVFFDFEFSATTFMYESSYISINQCEKYDCPNPLRRRLSNYNIMSCKSV